MARTRYALVGLSLSFLVAAGCGGGELDAGAQATTTTPLVDCVAPAPPPEAKRKAGMGPDGVFLLPGGRALTPAGKQIVTRGFPQLATAHPSLPLAYLTNTGFVKRSLQVLDVREGTVVQEVVRDDAFVGHVLAPDAKRLYASGGSNGLVEVYDVASDGKLAAKAQIKVGEYPAGLAISPDGKRLWVAQFMGKFGVAEIDTDTLKVTRVIPLAAGGYMVAFVPGREELYVSAFRRDKIYVVDLASGTVATSLVLGKNPEALVASPDGKRVYAALPDVDTVFAVDTATRATVASRLVGEASLASEEGTPLPASSPTGLSLDAASGRLYLARAGDNAATVLDAKDLAILGSIPTGWYPTSVTVADGGATLVVANGKGTGAGPYLDEALDPRDMVGTVSLVPLAGLDLAASSAQVEKNVRRPSTVYPFSCDGRFPVPTKPGGPTPIEHVVLVVKENKTYDSVLGDLGVGDGDPKLVMFGEKITPNLHALARRFAHHDNFYDDSETSTQGHLWLTSSFVNHYIERTWPEDYRGHGDLGKDPGLTEGQPTFGTLFTHLLKHKKSFTNHGEVVGSLGAYGGENVLDHTDLRYPGLFWTMDKSDEERARYLVDKYVDSATEELPAFTFLILPRDHTSGTSPNVLTPEAYISDNDYGLGLLIEGLSRSKYWPKTAVFIVEDDTQQGLDHVDYHRSFCVVASPWVKPGFISQTHTSYPSIFRTIELILGVPPINRYDAMATPMFDIFTMTPDFSPYTALPRTVPDMKNPKNALGAEWSSRMDFSGPDRAPMLGDLLWWHRFGAPRPGSLLARKLAAGHDLDDDDDLGDPDDRIEADEHDRAMRAFEEHLAKHPELRARMAP